MRKDDFAARQFYAAQGDRGHALWDRDLAAARPFRTPDVSNSSQTTQRQGLSRRSATRPGNGRKKNGPEDRGHNSVFGTMRARSARL
jgi:hypothetical protein